MVGEESFMLVSLKEDKAKKLAQVISNDTCRRILDSLSKNKATESELSEKLKIPISTVHYNLQQLLKSKLLTADEFHYSKKGKEVIHYSLANKYIIIAPKEDKDFLKKIKDIFPAAIVGFISTIGLYVYSALNRGKDLVLAKNEKVMETGMVETASVSDASVRDLPEQVMSQTQLIYQNEIAYWFFLGVAVTILVYIIGIIIKNKFKKQQS